MNNMQEIVRNFNESSPISAIKRSTKRYSTDTLHSLNDDVDDDDEDTIDNTTHNSTYNTTYSARSAINLSDVMLDNPDVLLRKSRNSNNNDIDVATDVIVIDNHNDDNTSNYGNMNVNDIDDINKLIKEHPLITKLEIATKYANEALLLSNTEEIFKKDDIILVSPQYLLDNLVKNTKNHNVNMLVAIINSKICRFVLCVFAKYV